MYSLKCSLRRIFHFIIQLYIVRTGTYILIDKMKTDFCVSFDSKHKELKLDDLQVCDVKKKTSIVCMTYFFHF